jgi:hypothetical protein
MTRCDISEKELGNSRQQVYRVIQAFDVMQHLLETGIPESELPATERLCREIRTLEPAEQTRVWKAVVRAVKQRGRPATVADVQTVVAEELQSPSAIDRQQSELIQKFEGIGRALKGSFKFDVLTPHYRRRLIVTLTDIAETLQILMAALKSLAIDERCAATPRDGHLTRCSPRTYIKTRCRLMLLNPCFFPSFQALAGSHHRQKPSVHGSEKAPEAN